MPLPAKFPDMTSFERAHYGWSTRGQQTPALQHFATATDIKGDNLSHNRWHARKMCSHQCTRDTDQILISFA